MSSTQYRDLGDATRHVLEHYALRDNDTFDEHTLLLWFRTNKQYYADHRLELYAHQLDLITEPLQQVYSKGRSLCNGVASDKNSMPSQYMLLKALVNAFENAVLLLICAADSFPLINECSDPFNQYYEDAALKINVEHSLLARTGKELFHLGNEANEYMSKAEHDIMVLAYTDLDTAIVSYDGVGPEYILATIMVDLFERPLYRSEPVDLVYAGFYRRLASFKSSHTLFSSDLNDSNGMR